MNELKYTIAAAKAADLDWVTMKATEKIVCIKSDPEDLTGYVGWEPLKDDSDALDLAARLSIVVQDTAEGAIATCIDIPGTEGRGRCIGNDRTAARRFAIVQCAASALKLQQVAA